MARGDGKARMISLVDEFGDVIVEGKGIRVEVISGRGVTVYTDGDVEVRPAVKSVWVGCGPTVGDVLNGMVGAPGPLPVPHAGDKMPGGNGDAGFEGHGHPAGAFRVPSAGEQRERREDGRKAVVVEWQESGKKKAVVLALDLSAQMNVAADAVAEGLAGEALSLALRERGAVLNDAADVSGAVAPAWQEFDVTTGHRTRLEHYRCGVRQDPDSGEAALQVFDAKSGKKTRLEHYRAGRLQDSGEPAVQVFDPRSGAVDAALRYQAGVFQGALSAQELAAFAAAKGLKEVPESVRRLMRPDLKPV